MAFGPVNVSSKPVDIKVFKDDPQGMAIAREMAKKGLPLTRENLVRQLRMRPNDSEVIERMLEAAATPSAGEKAPQILSARNTSAIQERVEAEVEKFKSTLDLVGQTAAKEAMARVVEMRESEIAAAERRGRKPKLKPFIVGMPGPSGVGKSETWRALAKYYHGDPSALIEIPCNGLLTKESLSAIFGAAPGLKGTADIGESPSPLGNTRLDEKFPGRKRPILIVFNEVDKIGGDDPEEKAKVIKDFVNSLGEWLDTGEIVLANGEPVTMDDVIIGFTSNAGSDTVGEKQGRDMLDHFVDAFQKAMPEHIRGRIRETVAYERHTELSVAAIAERNITRLINQLVKDAAEFDGNDISLKLDPELTKFLGEIGLHKSLGARPLEYIVRSLILPSLREMEGKAKHEEEWELVLTPMSQAERTQLVQAFRNTKDGQIPDGVTRKNFPVRQSCASPKPDLFPYKGPIEALFDPAERPTIYFSDVVKTVPKGGPAGRKVVEGSGSLTILSPYPGAPAEMRLVKARGSEEDDSFDVLPLERKLAMVATKMGSDLKATKLDDENILVVATDTDEEAGEVEPLAYVYNSKTGEWREVEPPPVPLVGAALAGGLGKALLWGGRIQYFDGVKFGVADNPVLNNREPIEATAYLFNLETGTWRALPDGPEYGRVGAAGIEQDGKGYFIGGEELYEPRKSKLVLPRASREVEGFDFATEKFFRGPPLDQGVAFATAFKNGAGRVQLWGGAKYGQDGSQLSDLRLTARLSEGGEWKSEDLGRLALGTNLIPRAPGEWLVGPFKREDQTWGFDILRPPREDEM